jgi:plastocyanin
MKKMFFMFFLLFLLTISGTVSVNSQVTIGANKDPENYSLLELISNGSNALRLPQLTTAQRNALAVSGQALSEGLIIFNTDTKCVEYWSGAAWISQCAPTNINLHGGGIIGPSGQINPGNVPGKITSIVPPSGGAAPYAYEWQYCQQGCDNEVNWQPASALCPSENATKANYQPCALNNTTQFRRKVIDADGSTALSNAVILSVDLKAGTISQPAPLPVGGGATAITESSPSTGGMPTHFHRWEYCKTGCDDNNNWYDVTDGSGGYTCTNVGDGVHYTTCNITENMRFRRRDMDGQQVAITNHVDIQVSTTNPRPIANDINITATSKAVCQSGAATITASVNANLSPAPLNPMFRLYDSSGSLYAEKSTAPYTFNVNPATAPATAYYVSFKASNYDENLPANRKKVEIPVTQKVTPSVTVSADKTSVSTGETVTFTATPSHPGTNPVYQWKDNGVKTGSNSPTFTTSWNTSGSHTITCTLTSSETCVTSTTADSNGCTVNAVLAEDGTCENFKLWVRNTPQFQNNTSLRWVSKGKYSNSFYLSNKQPPALIIQFEHWEYDSRSKKYVYERNGNIGGILRHFECVELLR